MRVRGATTQTLFAVDVPETRYARSGDVSIAYQVTGDGPFDVVFIPPFLTHAEVIWNTSFAPSLRG
ncbi:MAG TPA: hypothetical protein VIU86_20640, partial [Gaiellaceae bacterium]